MHTTALLATAFVAMIGQSTGQQQCVACLEAHGNCSSTRCGSGVTPAGDKLYIGGLFATTPGDLAGGPENVEHFRIAAAMVNDKNDG